jgi:hypothetical protein
VASEKAIEERGAKVVRKRGGWGVKLAGSPMGRRGIPDRLFCYRGRFLAVEFKQPGKKATPLQAHELQQIRDAGGVAIVASDTDAIESVLDQIDAEIDGT